MEPESPPQYITVAEIAVRMRISKMTAYRLVDLGWFTYDRIGRSIRIHKDSFERYLALNHREQRWTPPKHQ